jgi:hypothetical protein
VTHSGEQLTVNGKQITFLACPISCLRLIAKLKGRGASEPQTLGLVEPPLRTSTLELAAMSAQSRKTVKRDRRLLQNCPHCYSTRFVCNAGHKVELIDVIGIFHVGRCKCGLVDEPCRQLCHADITKPTRGSQLVMLICRL